MTWVKVDDGYFRHPKIVRAGKDARDLDLAGMCYASANLTDGFIPNEALPHLAAEAGVRQPARLVAKLLEVVRWELGDGGHWVHDYLDYNPSREETLAARRANAERVASWRAGKKGGNAPSNDVSNAVTNGVGNASPHAPSPSRTPKASSPLEHPAERQTSEAEHTPPGERALALRDTSEADFEAWWKAYPRREGKHAAKLSYEKRRKAGRSAESLLRAATHYAERFEREGGELRYVKHPATFLNQLCDEEWEHGPPVPIEAPRRPAGGSHFARNLANIGLLPSGAGR